MASQIISLTIVYSSVYSGTNQRKHQSSASLAFVRGIHRVPVNSPHKGTVTRKMFPIDDVIMYYVAYKPAVSTSNHGFGPTIDTVHWLLLSAVCLRVVTASPGIIDCVQIEIKSAKLD